MPDMIVRLPGDRRVVVDAKVPRMYLEGSSDRTEWSGYRTVRDHAGEVCAHMTLLSGQAVLGSSLLMLEFVVMFLPVEASLRLRSRKIPSAGVRC